MIATLNFHHYYESWKRPRKTSTEDWEITEGSWSQLNSEKNKIGFVNSLASWYLWGEKEGRKEYIENMEIKTSFLQVASSSMPQESTYLFSGSYTEFNKFYVLLFSRNMMLDHQRGIPRYNFLGIQGIFMGQTVLRFKQNFSGYIVRKMRTFRYPSPLKYKLSFSR